MSTLNVNTITGVQVFDFANTPFVTAFNAANGAYDVSNSALSVANSFANTANAGYATANASYGFANSVNTFAYGVALNAASAFAAANNVGPQIAPTFNTANAAFNTANAAFASANNVAPQVTPAFNTANSAYTTVNSAFASINSNWATTNSAYGVANTALQTSGGTVTGTLNIVGDLIVSGNVKEINANTLSISDPLIYLAANNYSSDIVDIGFVANYVNATGSNVHTGLYRSSGTKEYYLFYGYDKEPINNYVDPTGNNIQPAILNSTVRTSNLILGTANAINWIAAGYGVANAAFASANNVAPQVTPAFNTANLAYLNSNVAFNTANAAFAKTNTALQNTTTSFFTGIAGNLDASAVTTSINLPIGSTAQRPGSTANGSIRFNTNLNVLEYYVGGVWSPIAPPPTLTSATPTSYSGNSGTPITFKGTYFDSLAIAYFVLSNGSILTAGSTSVANSYQLTATTPRGFSIAEGPLGLYVVNGSGLATNILTNYISTGNAPSWSTAAGTIATCYDSMRSGFNTSVAATDADGQAVTYSLSSGSLPTGMSLNTSSGAITGTPSAVGTDTTYSFTLNATDTLGNATARTFNIVIKAPTVVTFNYTGGDQTYSLPSTVSIFTAYIWGGGGGAGPGQGGAGGYTSGTVSTSLGASFAVMVGGSGNGRGPNAGNSGAAYGFAGTSGNSGYGAGGGGLSGIFTGTAGIGYTENTSRGVLIAGGGGGGDYDHSASGGAGGGSSGVAVAGSNAGSQSAAGTGYNNGSYMYGASAHGGDEGGGGGGGGGYWGGGSGDGNSGYAGSGGSGYIGGRSGWTVSGGVTNQGSGRTPDNTGNAYYGNSAGYGGSGGGYNSGNAGRVVIVY